MKITRGIRNNNPANIRRSCVHWMGLVTLLNGRKDSSFCQFSEMRFGVRALVVLLRTYYCKHNLKTVHDILLRYAPTSENDTYGYIKTVSSAVGVESWDDLNIFTDNGEVLDTFKLFRLCRAICSVESGYLLNYDTFKSVVLTIL